MEEEEEKERQHGGSDARVETITPEMPIAPNLRTTMVRLDHSAPHRLLTGVDEEANEHEMVQEEWEEGGAPCLREQKHHDGVPLRRG